MRGGFYVLGGMKDDAVNQDEGCEEGSHSVQSGNFAVVFYSGGVAIHGHPAAAAGGGVVCVLAVGAEVPVDQAVEDEPTDEREDAFAQAHGNRDRGPHRAHPHEQVDDVLYHNCELAVRVPKIAMRLMQSAEFGFLFNGNREIRLSGSDTRGESG